MPQDYDYETRRRSFYGHEGANLMARRKMEEAGVPPDQLPRARANEPAMQNFLNESEGERTLRELQMQQQGGTPEQERQARAAGFPSYAAMRAYLINRNNAVGGTAKESELARGSMMDNAMAWHPKNVFEKVAGLLRGARGE